MLDLFIWSLVVRQIYILVKRIHFYFALLNGGNVFDRFLIKFIFTHSYSHISTTPKPAHVVHIHAQKQFLTYTTISAKKKKKFVACNFYQTYEKGKFCGLDIIWKATSILRQVLLAALVLWEKHYKNQSNWQRFFFLCWGEDNFWKN